MSAPPRPETSPRREPARPRPVAERAAPARPLRPATAGHPHRVPGPSSFDDSIVPRFRRRRATVHSRRHRLFRAVRSGVVTGLVLAAPLAIAVWLLTTPALALRELSVAGTPQVPTSWVSQRLAPMMGSNLLLLSLDEVRAEVLRHPWAAGAAVRKRLPDALEIELVERVPAAILVGVETRTLVDARGRPIAPLPEGAGETEPGSGSGRAMLEISGAWNTVDDVERALAVAAEFERVAGPWQRGLEEVEVLGDEDFRLYADGLSFPLTVRAGSLEEKIGPFARLLPEIRARYERLETVDLRFARRIVLQPEDGEAAAPSRAPSRG